MEPTGFEMDDFDLAWEQTDDDDDFHMPYGSNPPRRYREAYGNYRGGYGPGEAGPFYGYPPPLMGPPPPRRGPPLGFGPIFGPRGPPRMKGTGEARAMQFLTRCGLTREAVKQIPKDLLFLMEPQRCGLCCIEFSTFPLSRIHYMSKAHAAAQKKWMSHRPYLAGPKKEPLKARELYCELCDIQITSKVHGDSHYAGKAHLAVVEGRKQPKNPRLLTRGAQNRLEQLIRRETKALAKKPAAEGEEGAEAASPKKVKPVNPKYYCNICKTAVSCQEQMTMHMNGKKHLTKEKQHILKVMRGEAEETSEDNGDGADNGDGVDNGDGGDNGEKTDGQNEAGNGGDAPMEQGDDPNNEWSESWDEGQTAGQ